MFYEHILVVRNSFWGLISSPTHKSNNEKYKFLLISLLMNDKTNQMRLPSLLMPLKRLNQAELKQTVPIIVVPEVTMNDSYKVSDIEEKYWPQIILRLLLSLRQVPFLAWYPPRGATLSEWQQRYHTIIQGTSLERCCHSQHVPENTPRKNGSQKLRHPARKAVIPTDFYSHNIVTVSEASKLAEDSLC